jgi:magnesium-transporting ATPase (P-type)
MRYIKKIPPADKELSGKLLSERWKKLKEPSSLGMAILLSVPFMFINGIISMAIAYYLYPPLKEHINSGTFSLTINFLTLLILITIMAVFNVIHEFIHAFFIPNVLKSDKTYWGFNVFFGFVYTTEKIKKCRHLIRAC